MGLQLQLNALREMWRHLGRTHPDLNLRGLQSLKAREKAFALLDDSQRAQLEQLHAQLAQTLRHVPASASPVAARSAASPSAADGESKGEGAAASGGHTGGHTLIYLCNPLIPGLYLPHAEAEAQQLRALLGADIVRGDVPALVAQLRQKRYRWLHVIGLRMLRVAIIVRLPFFSPGPARVGI